MLVLSANSLIKRSSDVVDTTIDDQVVMMNVNEGNYCAPNRVGSVIWQLLADPMTFNELCQLLTQKFDLSTVPSYQEETTHFLNELLEKKLIEITSPEGS